MNSTNLPLVSVCLITYNHAEYIRESIESVLKQQVNFRFDLIIADDCSTDGTRDILIEFENRYPNQISLILQSSNVGAFKNWMDLLYYPESKYIAYLEGDDYWTDNFKLQRQVDFLESNTNYAGISHQSTILNQGNEEGYFKNDVNEILSIHDLIQGRPIHTNTLVFRREVLDLLKKAPYHYSGDRLLYFCIAGLGKFKFLPESMSIYRKHGQGLSNNFTLEQISKDLGTVPFLCEIIPNFPKYQYLSYVYASIGLAKNGSGPKKIYFLGVSFLYSFSYFPRNLSKILRFLIR